VSLCTMFSPLHDQYRVFDHLLICYLYSQLGVSIYCIIYDFASLNCRGLYDCNLSEFISQQIDSSNSRPLRRSITSPAYLVKYSLPYCEMVY
jgi:hypothetical protein